MIAKTIKYKDFNGVEREEKFFFNLTKAEIAEMELSTSGGMAENIKQIASRVAKTFFIKIPPKKFIYLRADKILHLSAMYQKKHLYRRCSHKLLFRLNIR